MKHRARTFGRLAVRLVVSVSGACVVVGCGFGSGETLSAASDQQRPTVLAGVQMPEKVEAGAVQGQATVGEGPLEFDLDRAGERLPASWDVSGTVESVEDNKITFRDDSGQIGHLAYRLPKGAELNLRAGQPISIKRSVSFSGNQQNYTVEINSGSQKLIEAALLHSSAPPTTKAVESATGGLALGQTGDRQVLRRNKYQTVYSVPVHVQPSGARGNGLSEERTANLMEPLSVAVREQMYNVVVLKSAEIVPTDVGRAVADEQPQFVLQYVVSAAK